MNDLHERSGDELAEHVTTLTHELNMLIRLAASLGFGAHVDLVERDGHTEIVVSVRAK